MIKQTAHKKNLPFHLFIEQNDPTLNFFVGKSMSTSWLISSFKGVITIRCFNQWDDNHEWVWVPLPYMKKYKLCSSPSESVLHHTGLWKRVMLRSKEISVDLRKRVVDAHRCRRGYKTIRKDSGLHQSTFQADIVEMEKIQHHCCSFQERSSNENHSKSKAYNNPGGHK